MKFTPPQRVELTEDEADLYAKIPSDPPNNWTVVADAMESLFHSLAGRDAIPNVRMNLFTDPMLAEMSICA